MKYQNSKLLISILAVLSMTFAPAFASSTQAANTRSEQALLTAGFKVKPATTSEQRAQIRRMPENEFVTVNQNGKTYYLYADKRNDRLFVGDHWAYQAYKNNKENQKLRKQGAFVWEIQPNNPANNRTVVIWNSWPPFPTW
jgi:homoserine trans-succinylase